MPQTPARHHAEWLSLLEISGPFLSMPVLLSAFPQGLDDYPPEETRSFHADYEYWKENTDDPATHTAWVRLVLESMLGYTGPVLLSGQAIPGGLKAEFPEHEETLRPDLMLAEPGTHKPRVLIQVYPPGQSLEKGLQGSRWQASIATRMMELLHATEIRLGLATNGEQWMLVDAPRGETTGFTTWYSNLWFDEPLTLRAFRSLLGAGRFFGVADEETLESLLSKSAQDQQEVTDQLGLQVRHAVEILIQSLDRADQDQGRKLLAADVPPALLYEAALTVMMRLVFMLSAEERKLLPIDDDRYAAYYAVSTLREQLQIEADHDGEEVLERRYDAWSRLLAVFRGVFAGIHHQDLHSPAYGGSLFDPDRYPFLEGRPQANSQNLSSAFTKSGKGNPAPLPVNNRTVLHLLDALQMLQVKVPGGGAAEKRRLSFRALDVEQIGHVYEGLLDHMATRATEPVLGLNGSKNQEPEVALSVLEKAAGKGEAAFLEWLHDQTGRGAPALKNALTVDLFKNADSSGHLRSACGEEAIFQRVLPFAGLLRVDDLGFPVVILPGSVYVTAGTTRRATGTHYTPRSLTEPIVQHTLEPLVYHGPTEGWPRGEWRLHTPAYLLSLKICDMAMGSAGFLVQVVRYLSERLVEAWAQYGTAVAENDSQASDAVKAACAELTAFGQAAAALAPEDQLIYARRLVAERCIYGVDKNPLAVEIAKLSLWLVTLSKDRPFTFLNHALKCGDSLVGASENDFLRWANRKKSAIMSLDQEVLREELETARRLRKKLESFVVRDVQDAVWKEALLNEAEMALEHVKRGADLLTGVGLMGLKPQEAEDLQVLLVDPFIAGELDGEIKCQKHPDAVRALVAAQKNRSFHWEIAFPEVFEQGGFSAFVGNPPFIGGLKISTMFGDSYFRYLRDKYPSSNGTADLCAFFFLRGFEFLKQQGTFGFIATNTISQGDTRATGLDEIVKTNGIIYFSISSQVWPGIASVYVSVVQVIKGKYQGEKLLDGQKVNYISPLLDDVINLGNPKILAANTAKSFIGSYVLGMGYTLELDEAKALIENDPKNKEVLFPYLNGQDLNSNFDQSPSRWVINFFDWPLERASQYKACFERIQKLVKPERDKLIGRNPIGTKRGTKWWHYGSDAKQLYLSIATFKQVLILAQTSRTLAFAFAPTDIVYSHKVVVFAFEEFKFFALLQSAFHDVWARKWSSTLKQDLSYTPSDVFQTFPFPNNLSKLERIGESYHDHRRQIMLARQAGLTSTYNRFHNYEERAEDIVRLRELHVEMDQAVASVYGWADLDLGHGFHEMAQGRRFTISEPARREVLSRLLKLNHERYEEEVRQGLHEKEKGKKSEASTPRSKAKAVLSPKAQPGLPLAAEAEDEPEISPAALKEKPTPTGEIGSWDACVCLGCGKHLVGFSVAEHTKKVHQGNDPGYRKMKG